MKLGITQEKKVDCLFLELLELLCCFLEALALHLDTLAVKRQVTVSFQMLPRLCDVAELGIPKTELIVGRHPCWRIVQHWKICLDGLLEVSLACVGSRQQVIGSIKLSSYFVACSQCLMASSVRPSFW